MKIMVTGGAGYIGSHATKYLLDHSNEVVVVDNLSTGHFEAVDKRAKFYHEDIANYDEMVKIFKEEKIEGVIHFAAFSLVGESMTNPFKYYENNVAKTNYLLKAMVDSNVKYLVFSSTAATYGEIENMPIYEDTPQNPTNVYGQTKLSMEHMIKDYHNAFGLNYVALRYFNVAGAYPDSTIGEAHNPETHLIPLILDAASGKRDCIKVFGTDYETKDGTCIRDYIHVMDLIDAHALAMKYLMDGGKSDCFNLGSGEGFSVLEMIDAAKQVTKKDFKVIYANRRSGDPATLIASSKKAREILKWNPQYEDINKMIYDAWNFHQNKTY